MYQDTLKFNKNINKSNAWFFSWQILFGLVDVTGGYQSQQMGPLQHMHNYKMGGSNMGGQPLPPHPSYAAQQHYPQGTVWKVLHLTIYFWDPETEGSN